MTVMSPSDQTTLADRKVRAGQRMIIGLRHPYVDDDLRRLVAEVQPAGFILFGRNIVEPQQVLELNRELSALVDGDHPAILSLDQEGGRVQRVREPATRWPPMGTVARAEDLTEAVSRAMALELRAMGFHLNFAPIADINSNPDNPVIGDRSFGSTVEQVTPHVRDYVRGHVAEGVMSCLKHFPGHGDTSVDSHFDLPFVTTPISQLMNRELLPFQAGIAAGASSIMTAHVVFPELDPELPATLSPRILPRLLRGHLGFDGVVFSDDMEMKAVKGRWPVADQARLASLATVDVLLCCKTADLQMQMFTELIHAQEEDERIEDHSKDALRRLTRLRRQYFQQARPTPDLDILADPDHRVLAARVRQQGGQG